jgi:phosphatidylglycerophosphatase A
MITSRRNIPPRKVLRNPILLLAFGFGSGCLPKAPGTFGTLVAIPLYILARFFLPAHAGFAVLTLLLFIAGIWLCERASRILRVHDHPGIVWDEIVGYFITMIAAPPGWIWIIAGFILFRIFDILKPWPVSLVDKQIEGGFGIMADDVMAAVYAWLSLQILAALIFPGV